jgi:hypothetical protein
MRMAAETWIPDWPQRLRHCLREQTFETIGRFFRQIP